MTDLARRAFDHRADLLAALVYGCLAYLSFNALADYANAHRLFPQPYGGWAFAVAIDGSVLYAFISFKNAPRLAGLLLVSGAAATYTLQRWHAEGRLHPLVVAGVVPGAMVLVTFAWHQIRSVSVVSGDAKPVVGRPRWDPLPPPSDPEPDDDPDQDQPDPDQERPKVARSKSQPALGPAQHAEVVRRAELGQSAAQIARELKLSDRARKEKVGPLVREVQGRAKVSPNGSGPGGGS